VSSLRFRNLDIDPSAPVAQWGVEGLLAAIDRGSLPDWRRIVSAINAEPWGPLASDLSAAIDLAEDRGVAATLRRAIDRARQRAQDSAREEVSRRLAALVSESGSTAAEFAARLGTSPSRLSTYLSGKVVPSAALLVRAEGVSAVAAENHAAHCPDPPT
jgi:hypothetical protein